MSVLKKGFRSIYIYFQIFTRLSHLQIIWRDLLKNFPEPKEDIIHMEAAMHWLCRSQDVTSGGGSSAFFGFSGGWRPPYPETTGYIISTFLDYYKQYGDKDYLKRAVEMGDWEAEIQLSSGAVRGGVGINDYPIVFNTGQVILGWTDLFLLTKSAKYLDAANRAAKWLVDIQDDDGKWSSHTFGGIPHSYHSRVSWSLLKVYLCTKDISFKVSAEKNIRWILTLALDKGWFRETNFFKGELPPTHSIAYTFRGLLESALILQDDLGAEIIKVVSNGAEQIMHKYERNKYNPYAMPHFLSATFNEQWKSKDKYTCLTGNAQLAIIWLKLFQLNNDGRFLNAALKIIDQLKMTQNLTSKNPGIKGAMAGSYPIWGAYFSYRYPNWATKFFADALMLQEKVMNEIETKHIN